MVLQKNVINKHTYTHFPKEQVYEQSQQWRARAIIGKYLGKLRSRVTEARFQKRFITRQDIGQNAARFSNKTCGTQNRMIF